MVCIYISPVIKLLLTASFALFGCKVTNDGGTNSVSPRFIGNRAAVAEAPGGGTPQVDFQNANTAGTQLDSQCPASPLCNFNSKYRTIDGSCNSRSDTKYGQAKTALQRILQPAYDDGERSQ